MSDFLTWYGDHKASLRYGQAFHQFFKLDKMSSHKEFNDRLYNADNDTAKRMINSILDYEN